MNAEREATIANAPETGESVLRDEFNRWAEAGRGEHMEEDHLPIVLPMLAMIELNPADRILDVGCGTGWLARRLAAQVPRGSVLGVDVSDEMIARARAQSEEVKNVSYQVAPVERLPAPARSFHKVVSVESAYYWPDPASGVQEMFRVLRPGGLAWILINYYRDNPHCHQWGGQFSIPAHLLSADDWAAFFRDAGFVEVEHRQIPDTSPTPTVYTGRWFRDAAHLRAFKDAGALLVFGTKPSSASQ